MSVFVGRNDFRMTFSIYIYCWKITTADHHKKFTFMLCVDIKKRAVKFMLEETDAENCVGMWKYAKLYDLYCLQERCMACFAASMASVPLDDLDLLGCDEFVIIMTKSKKVVSQYCRCLKNEKRGKSC